MTDISYLLYDSSSNSINIAPDWDSTEGQGKIFNSNRTPIGNLTIHTFATYKEFNFKYEYFPTSAAAVVNSWFDERQLCQLEIVDELSTQVYSVQIVNKEAPFDEPSTTEMQHYKGRLKLSVY